MPEISLTDFVGFVIKSGPPKLTHVRSVKGRPAYDPAFDFWWKVRLDDVDDQLPPCGNCGRGQAVKYRKV